jgi:hypothetical protein
MVIKLVKEQEILRKADYFLKSKQEKVLVHKKIGRQKMSPGFLLVLIN